MLIGSDDLFLFCSTKFVPNEAPTTGTSVGLFGQYNDQLVSIKRSCFVGSLLPTVCLFEIQIGLNLSFLVVRDGVLVAELYFKTDLTSGLVNRSIFYCVISNSLTLAAIFSF